MLLLSGIPSFAYGAEISFKSVVPKLDKTIISVKEQAETLQKISAIIQEQKKEEEYQNKLNSVRDMAMNYLGVPYVWGGTSPAGFDCSGLVQYVYRKCGYDLPRTTYSQIKCGEPVSLDSLTLGDIVFWGDHHVGIYIGDRKYIHAPSSGDVVKISSMDYYCPTSARRIIFRE